MFTRWTTVNRLYFPDSTEIASLQGLMLWCPEIKWAGLSADLKMERHTLALRSGKSTDFLLDRKHLDLDFETSFWKLIEG